MRTLEHQAGLSRFAGGTALAALLLIGVGGLVTSHEAGMAVPDWPTTYGYNMFLFPISKWRGGVLFEHVHRLVASGVGLLTVILAVWLWLKEGRAWLRWLGLVAAVLVMAQGLLGGLRVTEGMSQLGIVHAAVAHLFLVLVSAIALFTSRTWIRLGEARGTLPSGSGLVRAYGMVSAVVLLQLLVAATMRHQHAGLVIPDFPTTFGRWWPDLSAAAIAGYNQMRDVVTTPVPITAFHMELQLAHRALAVFILGGVGWAAWRTRQRLGGRHLLARLSLSWLGLIAAQIALGAATVWTAKSPTVATLHVVVGAMTLVAGSMLTLVGWRLLPASRARDSVPLGSRLAPSPTGGI